MDNYTNQKRLVEVILPLPLHASFTYSVPQELGAMPSVGCRVVVPFGKKKFYTGIVTGLPIQAPEKLEVKEVATVLDTAPVIRHPQLKFWQWLADYYLCTVGEVYRAAVPGGLKISSETFVEVNPDYDFASEPLTDDRDAEIVQTLQHEKEGQLTVDKIVGKVNRRGVASAVNRLIGRGVLIVSEKIVERYRTKKLPCVRPKFDKEGLGAAFEAVKGAKKQEALLLAVTEMSGLNRGELRELTREALLQRADVGAGILNAVVKKGLLEVYQKEINRFDGSPDDGHAPLPTLSDAQSEALKAIRKDWKEKDILLLHGVTSSGKTELYIHLIDEALREGGQSLLLVPEIALTAQLTRRIQRVFGNRVIIYHSKFSDNERVDIWKRMLEKGEPCVVIGARSGVFLPFNVLKMVIVDEEHESSYKQFEPAPRYNARDAAMVLAKMHGAKVLLGSATPAVETYYKAQTGKFGLVELKERYGGVELPPIEIVDMMRARNMHQTRGIFAFDTEKLARESLTRGNQVIFFQNRRGYAPLCRCKQCAWTPKCENCDVSLTYHKITHQLQCHYCGAVYSLPEVCPQCHEPAIEVVGYGTERIENEVEALFPAAKTLRMDLDTTRNKDSYSHIIDDFSERKADILVGTQMVTKGLDFAGVEMVGVLNADGMLNYPDFRASERAFNMLEQVAGRAGRRKGEQGRVLVQTSQPAHPVLQFVKAHDYQGYYAKEIGERRKFFYPPFCRVIYLYIKHRDRETTRRVADTYALKLRELLGSRVYGPEEPAVARVQGLYIRKIMLKVEVEASISRVKELLRQTFLDMSLSPLMKGVTVFYDVDPQ